MCMDLVISSPVRSLTCTIEMAYLAARCFSNSVACTVAKTVGWHFTNRVLFKRSLYSCVPPRALVFRPYTHLISATPMSSICLFWISILCSLLAISSPSVSSPLGYLITSGCCIWSAAVCAFTGGLGRLFLGEALMVGEYSRGGRLGLRSGQCFGVWTTILLRACINHPSDTSGCANRGLKCWCLSDMYTGWVPFWLIACHSSIPHRNTTSLYLCAYASMSNVVPQLFLCLWCSAWFLCVNPLMLCHHNHLSYGEILA